MPRFIIKPVADRDEYVVWSTVVDHPVECGSRAAFAETYLDHVEYRADRFERADASGTSAYDVNWFGWDHEEFLLHNMDWTDERWRSVKRENLFAYTEAAADGNAELCAELTETFDWDEEF